METRNHTIKVAVEQYLHDTGFTWSTFGQNVIEHYVCTVRPQHRHVPVSEHVDIATRMDRNGRTLERYLRQSVHHGVPVDLEDSIVFALPEPYRRQLMVDLCDRWGVLPAVKPKAGLCTADLFAVGAFMRDAGEVIGPLTEALADAKISAEDLPALKHAQRALSDHLSSVASLHLRVDEAIERLESSNVASIRRG